jgi:hypothetical protein
VGLEHLNVLSAICILENTLTIFQVIVWSIDRWERKKNCVLQVPAGRTPAAMSDTQVQFHQDQVHLLVAHDTQLGIYETTKLECLKQVF